MQKFTLLALLALNVLAPQVLAQDDDAELGQRSLDPAEPSEGSFTDNTESTPEPAAELPPEPPAVRMPARQAPPVVAQQEKEKEKEKEQKEPESGGFSLTEGRRRPGAIYGFSISRPNSIGKYNHYEYLYGKPKITPGFFGGYYLFSYLVDLGIVGRMNYYHAEGHPLSDRAILDDGPVKRDLKDTDLKDKNQKIGLTLIPLQLAVEGAISPFKTRWVVLRGWVGMEYLYVQETVEPKTSGSSSSKDATFTSAGWNEGRVFGAMASFSLTGLDARSDKSLRSLGIDRYYLSVFLENATTTRAKFGNFDRKTYGIAFSFEGLR